MAFSFILEAITITVPEPSGLVGLVVGFA